MNCEHCLQSSSPDGPHMDYYNTFYCAMVFHREIGGPVIVSGGEPTLHPDFFQICKDLEEKWKVPFTVCTNGSWFDNDEIKDQIRQIVKFHQCIGIQVYSNPKWYRLHSETIKHRNLFNHIPKCHLEVTDIRSMEDLGRARTSARAQEEIERNPYAMSCINPALTAAQATTIDTFKLGFAQMQLRGTGNCKPLVDYLGYVHMSESHHCPSVGNVVMDSNSEILENMMKFKPCGSCKNFKQFLKSDKPQHVLARKILGYE